MVPEAMRMSERTNIIQEIYRAFLDEYEKDSARIGDLAEKYLQLLIPYAEAGLKHSPAAKIYQVAFMEHLETFWMSRLPTIPYPLAKKFTSIRELYRQALEAILSNPASGERLAKLKTRTGMWSSAELERWAREEVAKIFFDTVVVILRDMGEL
jgi:hypothetical protein